MKCNLTIIRTEDYTFDYPALYDGENVRDISSEVATMQLEANGVIRYTVASITLGTNGIISISIPSADTEDLTFDFYRYELKFQTEVPFWGIVRMRS